MIHLPLRGSLKSFLSNPRAPTSSLPLTRLNALPPHRQEQSRMPDRGAMVPVAGERQTLPGGSVGGVPNFPKPLFHGLERAPLVKASLGQANAVTQALKTRINQVRAAGKVKVILKPGLSALQIAKSPRLRIDTRLVAGATAVVETQRARSLASNLIGGVRGARGTILIARAGGVKKIYRAGLHDVRAGRLRGILAQHKLIPEFTADRLATARVFRQAGVGRLGEHAWRISLMGRQSIAGLVTERAHQAADDRDVDQASQGVPVALANQGDFGSPPVRSPPIESLTTGVEGKGRFGLGEETERVLFLVAAAVIGFMVLRRR